MSVDEGKARGKDQTRFWCPICRSAIGQASCLICARGRSRSNAKLIILRSYVTSIFQF